MQEKERNTLRDMQPTTPTLADMSEIEAQRSEMISSGSGPGEQRARPRVTGHSLIWASGYALNIPRGAALSLKGADNLLWSTTKASDLHGRASIQPPCVAVATGHATRDELSHTPVINDGSATGREGKGPAPSWRSRGPQ